MLSLQSEALGAFCIYCHTSPSGKRYVGQTRKTMLRRWEEHCRTSNNGSKLYFHRAIRRYGVGAFTHETVAETYSQEAADEAEAHWIKLYNSADRRFGYNLRPGGLTSSQSEATKQKAQASAKRRWSNKTVEERSAFAKKRSAGMTPEERSLSAKARWAATPSDERSAIAKKDYLKIRLKSEERQPKLGSQKSLLKVEEHLWLDGVQLALLKIEVQPLRAGEQIMRS